MGCVSQCQTKQLLAVFNSQVLAWLAVLLLRAHPMAAHDEVISDEGSLPVVIQLAVVQSD